MTTLKDRFGRVHNSLRVSVVDRCNLRCQYCMPAEGLDCVPRSELLSFEEIVFAVQVANSLGIYNVRITGGEPLLRRDLAKLIAMLKAQTDTRDIALTSNAMLLDRHAEALAAAGLDRINISLDSLRADRFEKITRIGALESAWRGIRAAVKAGLVPLKINALLLEGFNDDEIDEWIELTMTHDITVRFMELMPIGEGAKLDNLGGYLNLTEFKDRLVESHGLVAATRGVGNGPARYWKAPGALGKLGFITPLSNNYCDTCSRMRLTSTGELRACLASDEQIDIRPALRASDAAGVEAGFRAAVLGKPAGHQWREGKTTSAGMSAVGG